MKAMSYVLTVLLWIMSTYPSQSAYLNRIPVTVRQPDGTLLQCLATGDEFHNWLHDKNDFTIMRNPATGYYVYATLKLGKLYPTSVRPGRDDPTAAGLVPGVNISSQEWTQNRLAFLSATPPDVAVTATTGSINNIVIFIRFQDEAEFVDSVAYFSRLFNSPESAANSMYNYFREVSYNTLTITSSFYPVSTGATVLSYQDTKPRNYYKVYDATTNPVGYINDAVRREREHALLTNAVVAVRSQIPTTLNIDANNDGFVDNVCFIISGSTEAWASLLWPHKWSLYSNTTLINGKRVYAYNFQLRDFLDHRGNGVLCHEMLHTLGAPDLYRYSGGLTPVGSWDIMAQDANPPQHPTTFLKYKYLHWIPSIPEIARSGQYFLSPTSSTSDNCYRIASPNSTKEYFVVEYRRKSGTFERSLPGEGLIFYRINPITSGNASGPPDEVYVYRPYGTSTYNGGISQANFSLNVGRTMFSDSTSAKPFLFDNGEGGLYISDIGTAGNTITFKYQKPGISSISAENLVLGQQGSTTVVVISPRSAEYKIEVRDKNGTGLPPWIWSSTTTSAVQVNAGCHWAFSLSVQPTSPTEEFTISLLQRNTDGSWGTFASQQVSLNATGGEKGTLIVTTADAEGWPGPFDKANVVLFDSSGAEVGTRKTNSSGIANFGEIPSGSGYWYKVLFQGIPPFGEQYWGSRRYISVIPNVTNNESFVRNAPFSPLIGVFNDTSNAAITTRDTIAPGTKIRVEIDIRNPNYVGSLSSHSRARLIIDRDMLPSFDFEMASSYQTYNIGQTRTISFAFTPTTEGQYYFAAEILTDVAGFETTTDAGPWGNLFMVKGLGIGTGDLSIAVSDAEDWGGPGNSATIRLFDNIEREVGVQSTDATSTTIFSGVTTGTGYSYKVNYLSNSQLSPFGEQFWGTKTGIVIVRGATSYENFIRNRPYATTINAYDSLTNADVGYDSVHSGATLRIAIDIKNPGYVGANPAISRCRVVLDRDRTPPFDFDKSTEWVDLGLGESKEMSVYFKLSAPGAYFIVGGVSTDIAGIPTVTDAGVWKNQPFVIVQGVDTDAPPPPINLAASPASWTNSNTFSLDWVNPVDQSGIAAAWCSIGTPPTSSTDGIRSNAKPFQISATAHGGQTTYLWLEDSVANIDHSSARSAILFYDGIPPIDGTLLINAGAVSTTSLNVSLHSISARDTGGSGIAQMHFSNNDQTWSDWEPYMNIRNAWDLSQFGGSSTEGQKVVCVQFKDFAGNISMSFRDTIDFRNPDLAAPPPPQSVVAAPAGWSKLNSFSIDWTNPSDPSGIAAAWYKRGTPPSLSTDGTRLTSKPIVVAASAQGGQAIYLWLEDGSGNKDCNNRSSIMVFLDETPPSNGTISINDGAPSTTTLIVSLNGLGAHDAGGSGLQSMRFSNNDSDWTPWEQILTTRSPWNLSEFGGSDVGGTKHVYVQYRDSAGNISDSFSDAILYSSTSVQMLYESAPTTFALKQNYPNPFNPTTAVVFQVPNLVHTSLRVHNLLGEVMAILVDESLPQGTYRVQWDAQSSPSGVYFVRMIAGSYGEVRRMLLVR